MTDDSKILELEEQNRAQRRARLARFRKWLRYLPRRSNVGRYPVIRNFAAAAKARPYLWSFDLANVRKAIYLGTIISMLPVYGLHTLIAFGAAILFRANLGVSVGVQVITNPVTAFPLYFLANRVGAWMLRPLHGGGPLPLSSEIYALILGGLVVGFVIALLLDVFVRIAVWEARQLRERHRQVKIAADEVRARAAAGTAEEAGPTPATGR